MAACFIFRRACISRFLATRSRNFTTEGSRAKTSVSEFSENGLTLRAGDDLKAINQVGRDILLAMIGAIPTVILVTFVGSAWVASKAIAPVEEIRQAAKRITAQR